MMQSAPLEIERKYIIRKPDVAKMRATEGYSRSEILQIYLTSAPHETHRIRRRKFSDRICYTETVKKRIDRISAYEDEREITAEEFDELSKSKKAGTRAVNKVRHTFLYRGKTYEVDIYPRWRKTCIMEIELQDREEAVSIPPFISVVKEVTGDRFYSNASMSASFPAECKDET